MSPELLDLTGLEGELAGVEAAVRTSTPGPGLHAAATTVRNAIRAVSGAPTGADRDAEWTATRAGDHLTVFGPSLLIQASLDGSAVMTARAVVDSRALQCDFGDPTARVDPDPTRLVSGGLDGIVDRLRGTALGKLGVTAGGIRVRLVENGQTLDDWQFDDTGAGEPVAEIAARELEEAGERLENDLGRAAEPEDMPPRTGAGSIAGSAASGASPGGIGGTAAAGVSAAVAAAATRALMRKAREKQAERRQESEPSTSESAPPPETATEPAPPPPPPPPPTPSSSPPPRQVPARPPAPPPPPPPPPQEPVWTPTHAVGADGLYARDIADATAPVVANLSPGVLLRVVEQWGAWARVEGANGWSGWVDGRRLIALR